MNVESQGGLLGIFPEEKYEDSEIQLRAGDRLFVYTDGIEVAFADDQCLNLEQWRKELVRRREMPTEQLLVELSESLDKETGSLQPKDDVSIVVLEVK
jgi:serine phosphatase RsbU (regulator of sigma subunit)